MSEFWITQHARSLPFDDPDFTSQFTQDAIGEARLYPTPNVLRFNGDIITTVLNTETNLTNTSKTLQFIQGTAAGASIVLPDARTLRTFWKYEFINTTSQTIAVKDNVGTTLFSLSQNSTAYLTLQNASTQAGGWIFWQVLSSSTASGIINYTLDNATAFTTSVRNPTYALVTGFTITPQAGTYAAFYNASVLYTTTPIAHYWAFYIAGVQQTGSIRQQDSAHSNQVMVDSLIDVLSVDGSQTIDVRVSCGTSGSLTVNSRTLILVRLGP